MFKAGDVVKMKLEFVAGSSWVKTNICVVRHVSPGGIEMSVAPQSGVGFDGGGAYTCVLISRMKFASARALVSNTLLGEM